VAEHSDVSLVQGIYCCPRRAETAFGNGEESTREMIDHRITSKCQIIGDQHGRWSPGEARLLDPAKETRKNRRRVPIYVHGQEA